MAVEFIEGGRPSLQNMSSGVADAATPSVDFLFENQHQLLPNSHEIVPRDLSEVDHSMNEWLVEATDEEIKNPIHIELINTELWLGSLSQRLGRDISIGTIPDQIWEEIAKDSDAIYMMGIFQQSEESLLISKRWSWQQRGVYTDLNPDTDMRGCPFAIKAHVPDEKLVNGSSDQERWSEWDKMKEKANEFGLDVVLDIVPNHVAMDHGWIYSHPEYFIQGTKEEYEQSRIEGSPNYDEYFAITAEDGKTYYIAHGKDPHSYPWTDTAQLNYANPQVLEEIENLVLEMVRHSDGARVDMSYLTHPQNFRDNWGHRLNMEEIQFLEQRDEFSGEYVNNVWRRVIPKAKDLAKALTYQRALNAGLTAGEATQRAVNANYYFIAEVYGDENRKRLESTSYERRDGFEYMYGMDFYHNLHRLLPESDSPISPDDLRNHMSWILYGNKKYTDVIFPENHDDAPAVGTLGYDQSKAAALIELYLANTVFLENQGLRFGRDYKVAMQMRRFKTDEREDEKLREFYDRNIKLRRAKLFQTGECRLAGLTQDNPYIFSFRYESPREQRKNTHSNSEYPLIAYPLINYSEWTSSCKIPEIGPEMDVKVVDLITGEEVSGIDMVRNGGFYVELEPWKAQMVFFTPKEHTAFQAA